jgi:hypothetical protein
MPTSVNFCQHCRNLSHETVPFKGQRHEMDILYKSKIRISHSVFALMVFNLGFTKSLNLLTDCIKITCQFEKC